jgi:hypothetical protein
VAEGKKQIIEGGTIMNNRTFNRFIIFIVAVLLVVVWPAMLRAQVNTIDKQATDWSNGDKAERDFKKAHEEFLKKDSRAAATEIRKAAALLKREEGSAAIEGEKDLSASAQELEKLAADVEKGTVTSGKELDNAFARAHYALARNYYLKASEFWAGKETSKTGHNLKSAAGGLERGLAWAGHKAETGTQTAIRDARAAGDKLIKDEGWVKDEVDKGIKDLGEEIEKLSKKIEPPKK